MPQDDFVIHELEMLGLHLDIGIVTNYALDEKRTLLTVVEEAARVCDVVIAYEYAGSQEKVLPEKEYYALRREYVKMSLGKLIIPGTFLIEKEGLVTNTCLVCVEGEDYSFKKAFPVLWEFDQAKSLGLQFGTGRGHFTGLYNGIYFGVEICRDNGILQYHGVRGLDMVFFIGSAYSGQDVTSSALRPGGVEVAVDRFSISDLSGVNHMIFEKVEGITPNWTPSLPPDYLSKTNLARLSGYVPAQKPS